MNERKLPRLHIGRVEAEYPIIQGGMGIGVSNYELAGHVSKEGGIGIVSSAALDRLVFMRHKKPVRAREAASIEIRDAKAIAGPNKPIGINIMVAIQRQYEDSVLGALDGEADLIISGAGLPLRLPEIVNKHPRADQVSLVPIASSGRVLELICKRWQRSGRLPDAVIIEGPLAGGHIAWRTLEEANDPRNTLDNLIRDVVPIAQKYGNIPVIAAGGIYSHEDIVRFIDLGCAGVQMGTRFMATIESGATSDFKNAVVKCKEEDILLADKPGSPCHMLFRVIENSPFYQEAVAGTRKAKCDKGYVLQNGNCPAKEPDNKEAFCICNGLLSAVDANNTNEKELHSVGANAHRIDKIISVADLMKELTASN